jgi:hypothetical protein
MLTHNTFTCYSTVEWIVNLRRKIKKNYAKTWGQTLPTNSKTGLPYSCLASIYKSVWRPEYGNGRLTPHATNFQFFQSNCAAHNVGTENTSSNEPGLCYPRTDKHDSVTERTAFLQGRAEHCPRNETGGNQEALHNWWAHAHISSQDKSSIHFKGQIRWKRRMASSGMLRSVALVSTDVSEELIATIIRMTRIDDLGTTLAVTSNPRYFFAECVGC